MRQSYRQGLKDQVACRECGEMLAVGSLSIHLMTQHGGRRGDDASGPPRPREGYPRYTGCPFRQRGDRGHALWKGARGEWRQGRQCGCTSCTGMSSKPW